MSTDVLGWVICGVAFVLCVFAGHYMQWLCDGRKCRQGPPTVPHVYDDLDGPCERCGGTTAHQYGVSVWWASTRRDGEVTYNSAHTWCSHCRETVEAEIDAVAERVVV